MAISKRLRFEVLRRDGFRCRYCGTTADETALTVDHVVPVALGGSDEPENLVAACAPCNSGKSSASPDAAVVAGVEDDAVRWAAAMRRAATIQGAHATLRREYLDAFDSAWHRWTYADETPVSRPADWASTIGRLFDLGFEIELLVDLVDNVLPRRIPDERMWRYFNGAVRNVLAERQQIAADLIEAEEAFGG